MEPVTITEAQLAAAFTEWDRRYREEPERFQSEATRLLKHTPETYGEACAPYLLAILSEQNRPCSKCLGDKRIANSEDGEPWSAWESLPPGSDLAVTMGVVRPITCPECKGTGTRP